MSEPYLTMAEIEAKYPNQWVLIDRPTTEQRNPAAVTGGHVVMHDPDRAEFDRRLNDADEFPQVVDCAILFVGRPPEEPLPELLDLRQAQ